MRDDGLGELSGWEGELEEALGGLKPAGGVGRERMLFAAGVAAGRRAARRGAMMRVAAVAAIALLAGSMVGVGMRRGGVGTQEEQTDVRVVYVEVPTAAAGAAEETVAERAVERGAEAARPMRQYVAMRARVLAEGLDALPAGRGGGGGGRTMRAGDMYRGGL